MKNNKTHILIYNTDITYISKTYVALKANEHVYNIADQFCSPKIP